MLGLVSPSHHTLIMPTALYDPDRVPFATTKWERADTYVYLTRLAALIGEKARIFPLAGLDIREPVPLTYRVGSLFSDANGTNTNDGSWLITGMRKLTELGRSVPQVRGAEYIGQVIRECVEAYASNTQDRSNTANEIRGRLRRLMRDGHLPYIPVLNVTRAEDGNTLAIQAGDGVYLPTEGWLEDITEWQELMV